MQTREKESLYDKIHNINRRYIWWALHIMLLYVLVFPIGIPVSVTEQTVNTLEWLEQLEPGSVILVSQGTTEDTYKRLGDTVDHVFTFMLEHDIKFVIFSPQSSGVSTTFWSFNNVPNIEQYEYGVDYVHFGFYAGGAKVLASIASDVWGTLGADVDGTPVDEIPLMQNIKTGADFDGWFTSGGGYEFGPMISNIGVPFEIIGVSVITSANVLDATTWFNNELMGGFVTDTRGCVEFAQITGYPSTYVSMMDAQSVGHMFLITLIVVGNVLYLYERFVKGDEK